MYITINHLLIDIEIFFTLGMKNEIGEDTFFLVTANKEQDRRQGKDRESIPDELITAITTNNNNMRKGFYRKSA